MTKFISFIVFIFFLSSCGTTNQKQSDEFIKTQNELTEKLTAISKETDFNGFGVALTNDNEVLYKNGFGVAKIEPKQSYTENTIQNIVKDLEV